MPEPAPGALSLVFITPQRRTTAAVVELGRAAVAGGATALLLRDPVAAAALAELETTLIVHRDIALALALGASGVHTGYGGPSVAEIRRQAPALLVGRSCHWPMQPDDRQADYLLLSPFRPTPDSHPRPLLTREQIAAVQASPGCPPVVALGGLDAADVPGLPDGLAGVAVVRAIADAEDPAGAAARLRAAVAARW